MSYEGIIPFEKTEDRDFNEVYWFKYKGKKLDPYTIKIVIDGLNDDLIISKSCTCEGFTKYQQGKDCKHIKKCLKELTKCEVNYRE